MDGEDLVLDGTLEDDGMLRLHRVGVFRLEHEQDLMHLLAFLAAVQVKDQLRTGALA